MKFKYFVLKRVCPQLGVNSVLIRNEEGKNGVFCTNTGGIYINSSKNQDYLYIPSHNISFVAFEIETPEPEPEPIKEIVKKVEEKPKTESVKQNNGASIKTNSREVSKARASARKSPRPAKTIRKTTTKNN